MWAALKKTISTIDPWQGTPSLVINIGGFIDVSKIS